MSELGDDARELIERALRDEPSIESAELQRIRRRVLAAGAGASIFGSVGKAMAVLGKASLGPVLKAFGLGVAVTVLALGIPIVLSSEKSPSSVHPRAAVALPQKLPERALAPSEELPTSRDQTVEEQPIAPRDEAPHAAAASHVHSPKPAHDVSSHVSPTLPARVSEAVPLPAPEVRATSSLVAPAPPAQAVGGEGEAYSTPSLGGPVRQSSPLVQEITLLEKVQSELRAGHGRAALALLDKSAAPAGGQLQAERLAAEVFAACQVGNVERARAAARLFLSKHASSPASARVKSSCAGEQGENAR